MSLARRSRGFTLMELMITIVILGILVAIAAPRMNAYLRRTNVDAVLNNLVGDIQYTRMLAVRSGRSSRLTIGTTGTAYTITTTQPDESTREAKRVNLAWDAPGFTLTPTTLTFNSRGLLTSESVKLKAEGRGQADSVLVLITGRPYRFD